MKNIAIIAAVIAGALGITLVNTGQEASEAMN
jgi:hypothetical protein